MYTRINKNKHTYYKKDCHKYNYNIRMLTCVNHFQKRIYCNIRKKMYTSLLKYNVMAECDYLCGHSGLDMD